MLKLQIRRCATLLLASVVVVSLTGALAGCRRGPTSGAQPEPVEQTETAQPTITPTEPGETTEESTVRLYFVRDEKIGVGSARVRSSDDPAELAKAAVAALLLGPSAEEAEFGLGTAIPAGVAVNGVTLNGTTATVDLTRGFEAGGGSLSMLLRVAQITCTLTQFDDIEQVKFELDGNPVDSIGGEGVVVNPPVTRADFEGQLPAILVERPTPGQTVSSPVVVEGSSNVFEATHQIDVTDPEGAIVAEQTVMATSGTGTRGTWEETIEFENAYPGRLGSIIVFEFSAKDGSRINLVEIPVRM